MNLNWQWTHRFFGKGLYWKETRQLLGELWVLLPLQLFIYGLLFLQYLLAEYGFGPIFLSASPRHPDMTLSIDLFFAGWGWGMTGLIGATFFSGEQDKGTLPFLLRMPVTRGAMLRNKILAALTSWGLLLVFSYILWNLVKMLWPWLASLFIAPRAEILIAQEPANAFMVKLGWNLPLIILAGPVCALCSTRIRNTTQAFLFGVLLSFLLVSTIHAIGIYGLRLYEWTRDWNNPGCFLYLTISVLFLLDIIGIAIWHWLRDLEEAKTTGMQTEATVSRRFSPINRFGVSLLAVEWHQKRMLWLGTMIVFPLALAIPFVLATHLALSPQPFVDAFFGLGLGLPPCLGLITGVTLWTRPEQDGAGFALHHLPIPRRKIVWNKILLAFGINILGLCLGGSIIFAAKVANTTPITIPMWLVGMGLTQTIAFLTGSCFSPLRRNNLTAIGLTLAIASATAITTILMSISIEHGLFGSTSLEGMFTLILVFTSIINLSYWLNIRSRSLEPGIRRGLRSAALCIGILLWVFLVALTDPIDFLYLCGLDLYRWM